jgi:hypothetical protein
MNLDSVVRAEPELEPRHAEVVRATLPLVAANIDRITAISGEKSAVGRTSKCSNPLVDEVTNSSIE